MDFISRDNLFIAESATSKIVDKPLVIGNVILPNHLLLAPMAGVTDGPFRFLCSNLGVGATISELVSAKGITMRSRQSMEMFKFQGEMRPFGIQIFGFDPDCMAEAAVYIESLKICDFIDINMGCPVSKVVKTGAGAALMKTPALAGKIIGAVKRAVSLPVTMKCRLGWDLSHINVRDFVKSAVDSGASAVTVHARTKAAGYTGNARWDFLEGMADICGNIPFIANGDLKSSEDLKKVHEISGCRGFMIGRGAIGKPWIFAELLGLDENFDKLRRYEIFRRHLVEMLMEHGSRGVALFRVHLFAYLRCHPQASSMRRRLCYEYDPRTILDAGKDFYESEIRDEIPMSNR